jgi:hypothetical protein
MASTIALDLRIPSEEFTMRGYEVEPLGGDLYRVVVVPGAFDSEFFAYHDVLRLRRMEDGAFELVEVAERGRWRMLDFVLSKEFAESPELAAFLARLEAAQGVWVRDFGGLLFLLLPPESIWDPTRELEAESEAAARRIAAPAGPGRPD